MATSGAPREPEHVVLYDGTCGVCHRTVQWIVAADARGQFHFAPLQGSTAAALRARHPDLPHDLDSVVYVDRSTGTERVFVRADAFVRIAERLDRRPFWTPWLRVMPRWIADFAYRVVARNRHHLSDALASCPLPSPAAHARFLP
jgi:predicted DCC family thiol-disulfide oxidoreductase YuxK